MSDIRDHLESNRERMCAYLVDKAETAFREGYKAGVTAFNTVGEQAFDDEDFHVEGWKNENEVTKP
jgi:ribosome modulation factor